MTDMAALEGIIRAHARPLDVQPTGEEPRLRLLEGIRAVVFDIYGTLLISGSGDVGVADVGARPAAFEEALAAVRIRPDRSGEEGVVLLGDCIAAHHQRRRMEGIDFPEVEIRDVWRNVLREITPALEPSADLLQKLALEFEMRTNPVWPMPGARELLAWLKETGRTLGIISNAQFYTPLLFPPLLSEPLERLGFRPELCFFSYEQLRGKPGAFLFEAARITLMRQDFLPEQILYVGNDMLKDVMPAQSVGFKTALFAGDARSLRWRRDDPRVQALEPDVVITEMSQLRECLRV